MTEDRFSRIEQLFQAAADLPASQRAQFLEQKCAGEPEIRVRPHAGDGFLNIDVIDNGGGVSAEEAATVFEKFTRGSRAGPDQGAGLGLPISRAIMRTMGGCLTVEFAPDDTSFFRLALALARPA